MTDAIDLTKEQRNTLSTLLRRFLPGVAVWAYGSRVKWTAHPNSDLDLVAFTAPAQRSQVAELKDALAESNLPFPVDLHVWDEVPERFREIIRKDYVVLQEAKQPESGSGGLGIAGESPIEYDLRWPVVSLAEIAIKIGSGATPKGGADAYLPSRARFALVRSQNVFDRRFDYNGLAFISDEQADGLRGVILQPNDILLNITGDGITFGRACMLPKDVLPACVNQHVSIIRLDPQRADAGYVLAFLTHPEVKSYIESFNAGGSRRAVTKGHIESFRLPLPPLQEQRAIAHILGTLDDKIELNRQMNGTLEEMARTLFKSWFIDFDPVRAKAEGRDLGLPKHVADLFPDSLEDSELGEIPRGWEVGTLADMSALNPEVWSKMTRPSQIRYVDLSNTKWGRIEAVSMYRETDVPSRAQRVLRHRDTIVGTVRPGNGSYAFVTEDGLTGSTGFAVLRPARPEYAEFVYLAATASENIEALSHLSDGGAYPAVRPEVVAAKQIVRPTDQVIDMFSQVTAPLFAKMSQNECESRNLSALRDVLLPKLISGELRVKDVDRIIAEVT